MTQLPILDIANFQKQKEIEGFYTDHLTNHLTIHDREINIPHKHNFYLTILFTRGHGTHEVDFDSYQIEPGSLFLLNPGQTHHWELSPDIEGYIFIHSQAFFDLPSTTIEVNNFPFFYSTQNSPCLVLNHSDLASFTSNFQLLVDEYQHSARMKAEKIHSIIQLIYIDTSRLYLEEESSTLTNKYNYAQRTKELEHLIERHYLTDKSANFYADQMNVSSKHLNRITRQTLNKTTSALIAERIILEAKRMLVHADLSLNEISQHLGYEDYAYFSRLFKKHCEESPSQFQSRYKF